MALFFAPRLWANSDSVFDLLNRFDSYAQTFQQMDFREENVNFIGMASEDFSSFDFSYYKHLNVRIFRKGFSGRVNLAMKFFKSVFKERIVISGDPYLAFWVAWITKKILFRKYRIQISIHGIPLDGAHVKLFNPRSFALRSACRNADSIRVVSQYLNHMLQNDWKISRHKIIIAPMPVQVPQMIEYEKKKNQILILGRLHHERGIFLSLEIALKVLSRNPDTSLLVIGDGPLRSRVELNVNESGLNSRISILGKLPHPEVLVKISESRVLLSSAPQEGFGLAIREAAYSGLSVVALKNSGTIEAERELPASLRIFSTVDEAVSLCELALRSKLKTSDVERIRQNRHSLNEESLRRIALSWL